MAEEEEDRTLAEQLFHLALAEGYRVKIKADGWKLWCERIGIPPFPGWEYLPGFKRVQRALDLADRIAFSPEGLLRWLNTIGPAGTPELAELPKALTAETHAAEAEEMFRERAKSWGG
jgi:hypothetical protein